MTSLKDVEEEKTEVEDDPEKSRRDRRKAMSHGVLPWLACVSVPALLPEIHRELRIWSASLRKQLTQADLWQFDKKSQRTKSKSDPDRLKRLLGKGPKDGEERTKREETQHHVWYFAVKEPRRGRL